MTSTRTPRNTSSPLLVSLDAEWARLRHRPGALRRARGWPARLDDPTIAAALARVVGGDDPTSGRRLSDLQQIVEMTCRADHRPGGPSGDVNGARGGRFSHRAVEIDADEVLAALVTIARVDEIAARVVLQRILPAVISQSRKWAHLHPGHALDLSVGACSIAIATYDPERRPRHIAAALVSDVIWSAFRQPSRLKSSREIPTPNAAFARRAAPEAELDPIVALAGAVRAAHRAGVEREHLDLVRELARVGSPSEVARRHHVTPRTIRNRRDTARDRICAALGPEWIDWRDRSTAAA